MRKTVDLILTIACLFAFTITAFADIKVRQKITMSGQTFETVRMIKGSRERNERKTAVNGGAMDFMSQVATITQCDLRRTVQVNDIKKLYWSEPFAEESEAPAKKPVTGQTGVQTRRGGTITMTLTITDTGERQTIFGLPARHLITVQETESSPDSCSGASKSKMEIDGWYVDFSADFNCPVNVAEAPMPRSAKPDCQDRIITRQSGKGKPGFLLNGTMKFYDQSGRAMMTQTIETLELSRETLAAGLFDVPQTYKLVSSPQDLYSMPSMSDLMKQQQNDDEAPNQTGQTNTGVKTVGLNINSGGNTKISEAEISRYFQEKLRENNFNSLARATGSGLDYVLNVEVKQIKESTGGKIGGIFGKVTGVETKAGKTDVELIVTLTKPNSSTPVTQSRIAKKYDGAPADAVRAAIDEAMDKILAKLEN